MNLELAEAVYRYLIPGQCRVENSAENALDHNFGLGLAAGGALQAGLAIAMPTLFEKSGAEGEYRRFKFEILKLAEKNALPGYDLTLEAVEPGAEPAVRMRRDDAKGVGRGLSDDALEPADKKVSSRKLLDAGATRAMANKAGGTGQGAEPLIDASALIRRSLVGLSDAATRGFMTEETMTLLRGQCPGWDLYTLHAEFETWTKASADRTPANWQKAFIGWVRRHHEKHQQTLHC